MTLAPILKLPSELIFEVATYLEIDDLARSVLLSRKTQAIFDKVLYERARELAAIASGNFNPLFTAIHKGQLIAIKNLLERKIAPIDSLNHEKLWYGVEIRSVLHYAIYMYSWEDIYFERDNIYAEPNDILEFLLSYPGVEKVLERADELNTPLEAAIKERNPTGMRLLLDAGADTNTVTRDPWDPAVNTLAHKIVALEKIQPSTTEAMLRIFAEYGGDIEARNLWGDTGRTPLFDRMFALIEGEKLKHQFGNAQVCDVYRNTIRILLELGCDIDAEHDDGQTPRKLLMESGNDIMWKIFLEAGVLE